MLGGFVGRENDELEDENFDTANVIIYFKYSLFLKQTLATNYLYQMSFYKSEKSCISLFKFS